MRVSPMTLWLYRKAEQVAAEPNLTVTQIDQLKEYIAKIEEDMEDNRRQKEEGMLFPCSYVSCQELTVDSRSWVWACLSLL